VGRAHDRGDFPGELVPVNLARRDETAAVLEVLVRRRHRRSCRLGRSRNVELQTLEAAKPEVEKVGGPASGGSSSGSPLKAGRSFLSPCQKRRLRRRRPQEKSHRESRYSFDGVVNNVGLVRPQLLGEIRLADLDDVLALNLNSAVQAVQTASPGRKKAGDGSSTSPVSPSSALPAHRLRGR
jgi:NAD(P)-dependent dehydrogenase (short-subunit alcohol dehydrogenase family)